MSTITIDNGVEITYTSSNNSITITKIDSYGEESVVLPETINGDPVVAIGEGSALQGSGIHDLISLTLPAQLQTIGERALSYYDVLETLQFPEGVSYASSSLTSIGTSAFEYVPAVSGSDHNGSSWSRTDDPTPQWVLNLFQAEESSGSGDPYITPFF